MSINLYNPILNNRYYLVYQYLHIAQTKVGFNPMPITKMRVLKYLRLYVKYGMTISQIDRIIDNINQ